MADGRKMKAAIKYLTLIDLCFVLFLILSGMTEGIISDIIYYSAFIIPIAFAFVVSSRLKTERERISGVREPYNSLFRLDGESIRMSIPLIFPSVLVVFLLSMLTSVILGFFGFESTEVEVRPLYEMLFLHALLPAVCEELLFRYVPLSILAPYSRRACVLLSSLYFSLIHCNLFQIPYALAAGFIFIMISLAFNSVWPSMILHFLNNALSVLWILYGANHIFRLVFVISLCLLAAVSLTYVLVKRREYKERLLAVFENDTRLKMTYAPLAMLALTLYIAIGNLIM